MSDQRTDAGDGGEVAHNARRWDVPASEYYSTPGIWGKSTLEEFRNSPQLFWHRYIERDLPMKAQTAAMKLGNDYDRFLLEHESAIEIPPTALSKSGSKAGGAWKEFAAENAGKLLLKPQEHDVFCRMAENIRSHTDAARLIGGAPQISLRWEDPETGLPLRDRMDVFGDGWITDLKTCADPSPRGFAKQCESLGYHRQCAMYCWGAELLTGRHHDWYFIAQRSTAPWDVATYTISDEWRERGMLEIRESIDALAAALETGAWEPPGYGSTLCLRPPKYTEFDDDYGVHDE